MTEVQQPQGICARPLDEHVTIGGGKWTCHCLFIFLWPVGLALPPVIQRRERAPLQPDSYRLIRYNIGLDL